MQSCSTLQEYNEIGKVQQFSTTQLAGKSFEKGHKELSFWNPEKKTYRIFPRTKFQKRFVAEGRDIMDVLDKDVDIGKMHRIMRHLNDENMILYSNHDKKAAMPANKELMIKLIGGNEKRAREFLNKIINIGIIHEARFNYDKSVCFRYYVSPLYTMASSGITLRLYVLFREQLVLIVKQN